MVLKLLGTEVYDLHILSVFKKRVDGLLALELLINVNYGMPITTRSAINH